MWAGAEPGGEDLGVRSTEGSAGVWGALPVKLALQALAVVLSTGPQGAKEGFGGRVMGGLCI